MVSHQDKIKVPLAQLLTDHLEIPKRIPPKYLTPKLFLSLQQKTSEISFQTSDKEFRSKAYCNKYFGQRILYVTDQSGTNRAVNSCKLFQSVKFEKNLFSKEGFKAVGDLILIGKDTHIKMNQITKALRGCKGKVSIELNKNVYQYTKREMRQRGLKRNLTNPLLYNYSLWMKKWLRNCHVNLQSLSLTFQSVDQFPVLTDNLRNLRHLSLKFDKKFARKCGWRIDPPLEYTFGDSKDQYFTFLLKLIQSANKLQTVRLDLAPYSITSRPLAYLLLLLNYYQIPDWYVRIGAVSGDFMKIVNGANIKEINRMTPVGLKSTSEVLEKVDFLGLTIVNYIEEIGDEFYKGEYEDYGAFGMSVPRLGELSEVTCKYKKILDVTLVDFSLEKCSVNLKRVLRKFHGLEGLYVKAVENVVIFDDNDDDDDLQKKPKKKSFGNEKKKEEEEEEENQKKAQDELLWARNLQEVFLTFLTIKTTGVFEIESQTKSFSKLMGALTTQCPQLNSLNVFRGHPVYHYDGQVVICKENPLIVPCGEITEMNSLTKLEITSDNVGLKSIGKALSTLKNLERLKINIVNNDHLEEYDNRASQTSFYEFEKEKNLFHVSGLKELEMVVNKSGYSIKWADHFAKYLGNLKSLEVLRVVDLNKEKIPLEVLMKIVDGLSKKRTLKRVEVDCVIVKNEAVLEFAAGLLNNISKGEVEDLGINTLQAKIVQMVKENPKLELVDIGFFKKMKIQRIFYDMRTRI